MPHSSRSAFALLVLGLLVPGVLPAQEPYLVRDINQSPAQAKGLASLEVLATSGGPYYSFDDGVHGPELWRGEGSGASLVHDLCPGRCGSSPRDFAELAGMVYFFANDGLTGLELWRTDGTPDGTVLVRDLCPGRCSVWPGSGSSLVGIGDVLFFRALGSGSQMRLWTSDGTREGTRLAPNISGIYDLTAIGDTLFFRARDSQHGIELWSSDGAETALVRDDCPGACSSGPARDLPDLFTPYGDGLLYWQLAGDRWRLRSIDDDPISLGRPIELAQPDPPRLAIVGNALLLTTGNQLLRIDIPTVAVTTVRSFPDRVGAAVALGSSTLFTGWDPERGFELWRSDGTEAGTQRLMAGLQGGLSADLVVAAGKVFFTAAEGFELWVSDGTSVGTHSLDRPWGPSPVMDMTPDPSAGRLLLVAGDPRWQPAELWATDGSSSSLVRHNDSIPGSTDLRTLTAFGDVLFFGARERPSQAYLPWRSDGTERGTEILSTTISNPMDAASFQGRLIFPGGNTIWTTDGTAPGTRALLDGFAADHLKVAGDRIYFSGQSFGNEPDAFTGFELWSSDGTLAGTSMLKDIVPGSGSSSPRQITPVGSSVFFLATTAESGIELWFSDGTTEGTRRQVWSCASPCNSAPQNLTASAGRLFFTAGSQLFSSSPAFSGVPSLFRWTGRSIPDLVAFQGRLFFFAEYRNGREHLWSSDGTARGTVRLQEVAGPDQPRSAHEPTVVGSRLYFTSWTEDAGQELWVSDGTAGGTSLLADIRPGPQSSAPRHLTAADNDLFFSADDGNAGRELWRTDGTAAGTRRAGDILPGPGSAAPADLTFAGKHLYFSANDGENGRELWALETEPTEPYTPCVPGADRLCLHGGRFEVSVGFLDPLAGGAAKTATAIPDSDESGFFWFFAPGNLELVVKLLDGRSANGQFWVFFGALSDVEYTVRVTDRATGAVKTYHNPRGTFCGQADTAAFPDPGEATAPARSVLSAPTLAAAAATGACTPGPAALCLGGGRFRAEARWKDHRGLEGTATAVPRTDESGTFWFFSPGNTELVVKVLDGTGVNGKFWIFYGALSDVEYWLTVTDTVTGAAKTWHNPPGTYCGQGDTRGL